MSVSNAFTDTSLGTGQIVAPGQSVTYEVTGTFTGFVHLERLIDSATREEIAVTVEDTALAQGTYQNVTAKPQQLRWRAVVATGTATAVITDVSAERIGLEDIRNPETGALLMRFRDDGVEIPNLVGAGTRVVTGAQTVTGNLNQSAAIVTATPLTTDGVGAKNGATVAVVERGNGIVHKTILTLTATPITLTDEGGVGQHGGVKLYDFPAGNIKILGAVIDAILTLVGTEWDDTAEGDVALGTAVPPDATALDATAVDILASTPIAALAAQVGPIDAQSAADVVPLGSAGGTDDDCYLNLRIDDDAAHITDSGTVTGTVTLIWINLGDF